MNTVYAVMGNMNYEGSTLLQICKELSRAEDYVHGTGRAMQNKDPVIYQRAGRMYRTYKVSIEDDLAVYDSYSIIEMELI